MEGEILSAIASQTSPAGWIIGTMCAIAVMIVGAGIWGFKMMLKSSETRMKEQEERHRQENERLYKLFEKGFEDIRDEIREMRRSNAA